MIARKHKGVGLVRIHDRKGDIFGVKIVQVVLPGKVPRRLEDSATDAFNGNGRGVVLWQCLAAELLKQLLVHGFGLWSGFGAVASACGELAANDGG